MASFIEDLLSEITQKSAAEEDKKDDNKGGFPFAKKDDDKKSDDDKKKDEDKDDKDKKDGDKEASDLFSKLASLHPDLQKLASLEADARLLAAMRESQLRDALNPGYKAASYELPVEVQRDVFNQAFETQITKLAALDPEFGAVIEYEQKKAAFNQGYQAALNAQAPNAGFGR